MSNYRMDKLARKLCISVKYVKKYELIAKKAEMEQKLNG